MPDEGASAKILLVASHRGGVGKTTTTLNLAAGLAAAGERVLVVDADPNGSVGAALGMSVEEPRGFERAAGGDSAGIFRDVLPNLDALPNRADDFHEDQRISAWLDGLRTHLASDYGTVLVDSCPYQGARSRDLWAAVDELLVVMRAEAVAWRTFPDLLQNFTRLDDVGLAPTLLGVLLTRAPGRTGPCRWEQAIRTRIADVALPETIPQDPEVARSVLEGRPLVVHRPDAEAAKAYAANLEDLERRRKGAVCRT